jgi:opine dehydrogenase
MAERNGMTVAVLGGGNGAFATAAQLALQGLRVNMFEMPEFAESIMPVKEKGGIEFVHRDIEGLPTGFAKLNVVSTQPEEVLADAEVVWLVVPAFGQRPIVEACASYFQPGHILVLTPGNFGTLAIARVLKDMEVEEPPTLVEAETMIYFALKEHPTKVNVGGYKHGMRVAALPAGKTARVLPALQKCYPSLLPANSILGTSLGNVNTVVHAPILLLNTGRVDSPQNFIFYHEGCTPSVGQVVEGVDRERVAVGQALGIDLPPMPEVLKKYYGHQGAKGDTLTEVLSTNPAYAGRNAPRMMDHRFLTEEIPNSMVMLEELGALTRVPTPVTSSLINLANEILGTDFRPVARSIRSLGLEGMSVDDIKEFVGHSKES